MLFSFDATLRKMAELTVGELIAFGNETQEFGFVVATGQQNAEPLVGVLKSAEEPHPLLPRPWGDQACLSFGNDWVVEPIFDPSVFPGNTRSRRAGWLRLAQSGWAMSFATSPVDSSGRLALEWRKIGGESGQITGVGNNAVGFTKWRIWANDESRRDPKSSPLFEYEAAAPKLR
ncbi:hypothetical protein NKH60_24055 [Mesorhizobium sp. M1006]|uniref:hypothetical protein n=1 Tax=Mesorhizobium sp. M1006 TaxID=2957048 RepID=UPI0033387A3D